LGIRIFFLEKDHNPHPLEVKVIWNAKIIIFSFLKILIYVKIRYIKNVNHSLFESYDV
jgi:hypothetical protein